MTLKIPVLALVDSDPYGLKILSVYMKGSMNMSYDSSNLTTPDIKWLGVRPSDLDRFNIPDQCRLPMTDEDIKTGKKLVRGCVLVSLSLTDYTFDIMYQAVVLGLAASLHLLSQTHALILDMCMG